MNRKQIVILIAMAVGAVILPLEGYRLLSFDFLCPMIVLTIAFVAFGKRKPK